MDEAQPRLLDETAQGVIGTPMDRPEGRLKVSGRAGYAADLLPEGTVHGVLVRATITRGRIARIDEVSIAEVKGLLGVFHGPRLTRNPAQGMADEAPEQTGDRIDYHGQPIALVVAESFEAARDGAHRLTVEYEEEPGADVDPASASRTEVGDPTEAGDWDEAIRGAAAQVDLTYTTPAQVAAAMEPHAAVAEWQSDTLILHGALQILRFNKNEIADALGIAPEKVRILSPYIGGGFGSKLAIGHDDRVSNLRDESFSEPVSSASQFLYGAKALRFQQTLARVHRTPAGSVRAPGEAVGMIAFEAALDELADKIGICPVELRLKNIPDKHPVTGQAFSARALAECLKTGAERFGWSDRKAPGTRREGDWQIGVGMASAARPNMLVKAAARVRLSAEGAVVETDMTDIGTGTYAILAQIAGEMLGLRTEKVTVRLGDTDLPGASGSGGSFGAGSSGSAVFLAARRIREALAGKLGCTTGELTLRDGVARGANREAKIADLLNGELVEVAEIEAGSTADSHFSSGFGAHFVEVAVHAWTGEVRVRRMLGVFGIGRVLNEKTARSQALGGMVWGIGLALYEVLVHDPRTGHVVTRDLANYHVAAHADIPRDLEVTFLEERDDQANPMQSKGVGELGVSGSGAAVLNAIHNACGARIRHLPATPDKVIAAMDGQGQ